MKVKRISWNVRRIMGIVRGKLSRNYYNNGGGHICSGGNKIRWLKS